MESSMRSFSFESLCICFLGAIICGGATFPVAASNLDHACLKACMASGGAQTACLDQCRYRASGQMPGAAHGAAPDLTPHSVFDAPVAIGDGEIVQTRRYVEGNGNKNLVCAQRCLAQGNTSGFCQDLCAKEACPPGAVLCASSGAGGGAR